MKPLPIKIKLGFLFSCFFLLILFFCSIQLVAQTTAQPATFNFIKLPYTAKATSLGGINISSLDKDLGLAMFQPALLDASMGNEIQVSIKPYYAGIQQYDLSGVRNIKSNWILGWGIHYMDYGDIVRTDVQGNELGAFRPNEYLVQVSIAKSYLEQFHFGTQLKFIQSNFGQFNSNGIALDAGLRFISEDQLYQISILANNIGQQLKYQMRREELPFNLILGFSKKLEKAPFQFSITAERLSFWEKNFYDSTFYTQESYKRPSDFRNAINHLILAGQVYFGKQFSVQLGYNFLRRFELNLPNQQNGLNGFNSGFELDLNRTKLQYANGYFQKNLFHHFTIQYALQRKD